MVDNKTNLSGYYYWGDNFPEFCITLREDNTCSFYKSPDSDYDLPLTPTGTSFNGHGIYTIDSDVLRYSGKGLKCFFGFTYSDSDKAVPEEQINEGEIKLTDLLAHRKGDAGDQINEFFHRIKG